VRELEFARQLCVDWPASDCQRAEHDTCEQRKSARLELGTACARLSGRPLPSERVLTTIPVNWPEPLKTGPPDSPFLVFILSTMASG